MRRWSWKNSGLNDCFKPEKICTSLQVQILSYNSICKVEFESLVFKGILSESYCKVNKWAPVYSSFRICVFLDGIDFLTVEGTGAALCIACLPSEGGRELPSWCLWSPGNSDHVSCPHRQQTVETPWPWHFMHAASSGWLRRSTAGSKAKMTLNLLAFSTSLDLKTLRYASDERDTWILSTYWPILSKSLETNIDIFFCSFFCLFFPFTILLSYVCIIYVIVRDTYWMVFPLRLITLSSSI